MGFPHLFVCLSEGIILQHGESLRHNIFTQSPGALHCRRERTSRFPRRPV